MNTKTKEQAEQDLLNARAEEARAGLAVDISRENYMRAIQARVSAQQEVDAFELNADDCEDVADAYNACDRACVEMKFSYQSEDASDALKSHPVMVRFWRARLELKEVRDELERTVNPEQPEKP